MKLTFLGATRTVTGSKFLLEAAGQRVLIDCGLFQGLKELRLRNWEAPPVDPKSVDAVILTHAHIDHTGYLPRFVRLGFRGTIYATPATVDLAKILLPDAASLQEEEAAYRNRQGLSKHKPALPLYTLEDAERTLKLMQALPYSRPQELSSTVEVELTPAGHILGSSFICVREKNTPTGKSVLFTGDIGRYNTPIIHDPSRVKQADYLVMESTYGDRLHDDQGSKTGKEQLREVVVETARRGGSVLIPSFSVGRAQELLYVLRELEDERKIPVLPVYLDSPMAISALDVTLKHVEEHDADMEMLRRAGKRPLHTQKVQLTRSVEESKGISRHKFPSIIISANGMASGGRILHHLIARLPDGRNSIVFVGYQAVGTRGRLLVDGARELRIFGQDYPVRARIHRIDSFSAHADHKELIRWLKGFEKPPRKTFLVHGEPAAVEALKVRIQKAFKGWNVEIPDYLDSFDL